MEISNFNLKIFTPVGSFINCNNNIVIFYDKMMIFRKWLLEKNLSFGGDKYDVETYYVHYILYSYVHYTFILITLEFKILK